MKITKKEVFMPVKILLEDKVDVEIIDAILNLATAQATHHQDQNTYCNVLISDIVCAISVLKVGIE